MWRSPSGSLAKQAGARQAAWVSMPSSSRNSRINAALGGFARFDLAAGKLPQTAHSLVGRTLLHKDATVGIDQRNGDDHERRYGDKWLSLVQFRHFFRFF